MWLVTYVGNCGPRTRDRWIALRNYNSHLELEDLRSAARIGVI